jgi:hypothetical protein
MVAGRSKDLITDGLLIANGLLIERTFENDLSPRSHLKDCFFFDSSTFQLAIQDDLPSLPFESSRTHGDGRGAVAQHRPKTDPELTGLTCLVFFAGSVEGEKIAFSMGVGHANTIVAADDPCHPLFDDGLENDTASSCIACILEQFTDEDPGV